MKKEIITIIILSLFVCVLGFAGDLPKSGITKTVMLSGKISDLNNNESLAGVKISCSNCDKAFYSDLDGNFFISLTVNTAVETKIEFSQIGYASKTLDVKDIQMSQGNLHINLKAE